MSLKPHQETVLFRRREYSAVFVTLVVLIAVWALYTTVGLVPTLIIGGSGILALVVWLGTTYRQPADPEQVLLLYLLLIAAELIHMAEEYLAAFPREVSELTGATMSQDMFVVTFVIGGTMLALISAIGLVYRNPIANYYLWFVIIGPGFVNGIAHVLFPIMAGQYYFPGLLTVMMPIAVGILLAVRIYRDARNGDYRASPEGI